MAIFTVTNTNDSGAGSLRDAVAQANIGSNADTIVFAAGLAGQTITLTGGELTLTQDVTIDGDITGDNRADITISGGDASRVIHNTGGGVDAVLKSLTITDGNGAGAGLNSFGGAILSRYGTMTIIDSTIRDNSSAARGGGIYGFYSALTIVNSLVTGNTTSTDAGGIAIHQAALTIVNTTVHGNDALGFAGGIRVSGLSAVATLTNSTVTGNHAAINNATAAAGGGMELVGGATVAMTNSVVADNLSSNASTEHDIAGSVTASNSVFGTLVTIGGGNGANLTNVANVGLGALLDNGASVLTRSPLDGSVLIGAGNNALLPLDTLDIDGDGNTLEVLPRDGRGGVRVVGGTVDVGAVEQIVNETIRGTEAANTILGGLGVDQLFGLGGADILNGGADLDTMEGGDGNDTYFADLFNDTVRETNAALVAGGNDLVTFTGTTGTFILGLNVERLTLGGGAAINGTGNTLSNTLTGNGAANIFSGLGGNDRITGGLGADNLTGGSGRDIFDFNTITESIFAAAGRDTITDFNEAATDRIDLSTIDANSVLAGNNMFSFIGAAAFTGLGQVRSFQFGGNTFVDINTTGTAAPDMRIQLTGLHVLDAADFVL